MAPPNPPTTTTTASKLFTATANAHLTRLQARHSSQLTSNDATGLSQTLHAAHAVREAIFIYQAVTDILATPGKPAAGSSNVPAETRACASARRYLEGLPGRLQACLAGSDYRQMAALCTDAQHVLDALVIGFDASFQPVDPQAMQTGRPRAVSRASAGGGAPLDDAMDDGMDDIDELDKGATDRSVRARARRVCQFAKGGLSRRDKCVLALYLAMVFGALVAMTLVTVEFAQEAINPRGAIQSNVATRLRAPVVTVCLSQPGVPFSRLQMFNFTDAEGTTFVGADPIGPQHIRASTQFSEVVERFWDNPGKEDCNSTVGDFFPFPIESLNDLVSGARSTKCRPCYRVGLKKEAVASSLAFQNSSVMSLYTDSYFLQCMKSVNGLSDESMKFLLLQLMEKREELDSLGILELGAGVDTDEVPSVSNLTANAFKNVTSEQACNIFYFALFPMLLEKNNDTVDIRYEYDGNNWTETGDGPYFRVKRNSVDGLLPTESLQMFVESNNSKKLGTSIDDGNRDLILIGPNTQTYASFRHAVVFGKDRYDIISSTSNLRQSDITPFFGYWLVYNIYYNYNRFVTDEWYTESTYPFSQWLVDVTGYASLFTGASLFSLLLLPLLRTMRRRYKSRLLQHTPEAYIWSKYRRHMAAPPFTAQSMKDDLSFLPTAPATEVEDLLVKSNTVMLPGYNV